MVAEIEDGVIINLLSSLVISLLISIEQQIPPHKKKARAIIKVEDAIRELAQLNAEPITEELLICGVKIWNKCIEELQLVLEAQLETIQHEQLELFFQDKCNTVYYTQYYTTTD
jgi:hypothetical protein